jgi:addiction module RelE/StbE family toxin
MKIDYSGKFKKNFNKRVSTNSSLNDRYYERLKIFIDNRSSPVIKDHKLTGRLRMFRAFWITGDIRVIYFLESDSIVTFVDIGTHNQVYS